jgi:hypothetical protein
MNEANAFAKDTKPKIEALVCMRSKTCSLFEESLEFVLEEHRRAVLTTKASQKFECHRGN